MPLLPPELAAYLGTTVELVFPMLLAFGLLGRFVAGILFLFNVVAVISYPDLNATGLEQHKVWGILSLVSVLHGPGKLSLITGSADVSSPPTDDPTCNQASRMVAGQGKARGVLNSTHDRGAGQMDYQASHSNILECEA